MRFLLLFFLLLAACAPAPTAHPPQACAAVFVYGQPVGPTAQTQFLCRQAYALLHDNLHKVPLYVAEHLQARNLDGPIARTDDFRPDLELPEGQRSELSDYRNSGYDRGHMAPAADFTQDAGAMSQSFLLSNMVPQNHTLNAGAWEGLENATRACAKSLGDVYVITGPILDTAPITIGANRVAIPSKVYKIIFDPKSSDSRAYIFPNQPIAKQAGYTDWQVSIDSVEQQTGLDFFPDGRLDEGTLGSLCKDSFGP